MGRSQVLYNRTAARMRAGRGRGAGRHDAADDDGRRGGRSQQQHQPPPQPLPPDEEESDMMADGAEGESNEHEQLMRRMQKAAKDEERKKEQEAEQVLLLSQATSQWASAQQVPNASTSGEQRHSFLGAHQEQSLSETEALCSRMGKALELGLSLSERLRLPPHLAETVYGPDRRKKEIGSRTTNTVPASSDVVISNPKQSNNNSNEQDDAVDALLSLPSSNNDEATEDDDAVDALLLQTKETGAVDDTTKTLIEGLRSELGSSSFPTSEAASYEGYDEDEDATRRVVANSSKGTTMTPRGPQQQHHGVHSPPTSPSPSHHPKGASSPAHYMEPTVSSVLKVSSPKQSNHKHETNDGVNHNSNAPRRRLIRATMTLWSSGWMMCWQPVQRKAMMTWNPICIVLLPSDVLYVPVCMMTWKERTCRKIRTNCYVPTSPRGSTQHSICLFVS